MNEFYFVVSKRRTKMVDPKIGKFNSGTKWYPFTTLWYRHLIFYTCEWCVWMSECRMSVQRNQRNQLNISQGKQQWLSEHCRQIIYYYKLYFTLCIKKQISPKVYAVLKRKLLINNVKHLTETSMLWLNLMMPLETLVVARSMYFHRPECVE